MIYKPKPRRGHARTRPAQYLANLYACLSGENDGHNTGEPTRRQSACDRVPWKAIRGYGDMENAARFPHPHTPGGDYGQWSNKALH